MRYIRAQDVLPADLLNQLQQYVDGAYLYIPRREENRLAWGQRTNSKAETAAQLAEAYFLTEKTIRRILLEERQKEG